MKIPVFGRIYNSLLKHPRYRWVVMGASLIYLISPIDISPDLIPVVGWIDDGVVATLLATGITQVLLDRRQAVKEQKALTKQDDTAAVSVDSEVL
ncbi:YkvA family protein [Leptolyngbya sp. KIOST-1]|uniref:YkvA family protein n=1 Tax=Leptolyngbya sp. KIOST-1 TaxID=1229172 RepID=UPI00056028B7|nr:DUF1232 domain-containing protein [Leptolyngbya sp. KIOST-1]